MSANQTESELLTVREAAALAACSEFTIRRRVWSGELPAVKLGVKLLRIPRESLLEWIYGDPEQEA